MEKACQTSRTLESMLTSDLNAENSKILFENTRLRNENIVLKEENEQLKSRLAQESSLSMRLLRSSDYRVKFYTGLPTYGVLLTVFNFARVEKPRILSMFLV